MGPIWLVPLHDFGLLLCSCTSFVRLFVLYHWQGRAFWKGWLEGVSEYCHGQGAFDFFAMISSRLVTGCKWASILERSWFWLSRSSALSSYDMGEVGLALLHCWQAVTPLCWCLRYPVGIELFGSVVEVNQDGLSPYSSSLRVCDVCCMT